MLLQRRLNENVEIRNFLAVSFLFYRNHSFFRSKFCKYKRRNPPLLIKTKRFSKPLKREARKLTGDNQNLVWAEFSTCKLGSFDEYLLIYMEERPHL
jgi:hypothetical protein